ncbi:MAG TPA: hypothetical protein VFK44_04000, partial [Bacillales bacterium]|nr:hypothetical protein [Bacillales bacterium]
CEPLLFDLEKDPHELHNLARQPEYREQVDAFLERIAQEYDMEKLREEILRDQQSRKLIHDALQIGKKTSWDHDPGW